MRFGKKLPFVGLCGLLTILLSVDASGQVTSPTAPVTDSSAVVQPDTTKQLIVKAPVSDTAQVGRLKDSPRKATLLSLALPGLGQAYNHHYWKLPILYAGFGTIGYFIGHWNNLYQEFNAAYKKKIANPDLKVGAWIYPDLTKENLQQGRELYRRYRDLNTILFAGLWAMNVVEANISAHLKGFDLSDDLSLRIKPGCSQDILSQPVPGLTLALTWK